MGTTSMQTFLPYPNFADSVQCLDYRRLGKQRVEAMQIHNTLTGKSTGWLNHPATKMWRGFELALASYHNMCLLEWVLRGYKNNMEYIYAPLGGIVLPDWIGDEAFHDSHKSNLLRKEPEHYEKFGWDVPNDLEYVWPV